MAGKEEITGIDYRKFPVFLLVEFKAWGDIYSNGVLSFTQVNGRPQARR